MITKRVKFLKAKNVINMNVLIFWSLEILDCDVWLLTLIIPESNSKKMNTIHPYFIVLQCNISFSQEVNMSKNVISLKTMLSFDQVSPEIHVVYVSLSLSLLLWCSPNKPSWLFFCESFTNHLLMKSFSSIIQAF